MITVRAAPTDHMPWLAERAGLVLVPSFRALEAVDDAGRIVAMVGFDGWLGNAVCMHVAVDYPAALRRIIAPAFGVAFDKAPAGFDKGIAIATILSTNKRSLELVRHLGFREVGRGLDWVKPGVDFVTFEMRRENCRFYKSARRKAA